MYARVFAAKTFGNTDRTGYGGKMLQVFDDDDDDVRACVCRVLQIIIQNIMYCDNTQNPITNRPLDDPK